MRYLQASSFLLALAAQTAVAKLTYTVTGTKDGKPIAASEIKLETVDPSFPAMGGPHILNQTSAPSPPSRNNKVRKSLGVNYSSNWCGAVTHTNSSHPFTTVHGYFQVPELSLRSGLTTYPQWVGEWIGIDGSTWTSAILQSGIGSYITSTGAVTNYAWWQWYPDNAVTITSMPVAADDWFEVTITASSATAGSITISNLNQNVGYTINLSGGTTLGRVDAEWIVETPTVSGGIQPMAVFTDVWFEDTYAVTNSGNKGIDNSYMYYISGKCTAVEYDNGDFYAYSS